MRRPSMLSTSMRSRSGRTRRHSRTARRGGVFERHIGAGQGETRQMQAVVFGASRKRGLAGAIRFAPREMGDREKGAPDGQAAVSGTDAHAILERPRRFVVAPLAHVDCAEFGFCKTVKRIGVDRLGQNRQGTGVSWPVGKA